MLLKMTESLRECSNTLKSQESDWIFRISINYFYDGEGVDLGARLAVCDKEENDFQFKYHSLILDDKETEVLILDYLKENGSENAYSRLKMLAEELKRELLNCSWLDSRTEVEIKEYD